MDHLYIELGPDKQLNEIVFAGSHDAGISGGGSNAKTQSLDILGQAQAGVRFFDVRVAAKSGPDQGQGKEAELKTFHAPGLKTENKSRFVTDLNRQSNLQVSKLKGETFGSVWGQGLTSVLQNARDFVTSGQYSSEFLILKFDKSTNWTRIAETCVRVLGDAIYTRGGNVNTKTLEELQGSVIVLFPPDGVQAVYPLFERHILGWKNVYKPPSGYDANFRGLQYWGAGGTSVVKPFKKIKQNVKNQDKIQEKAITGVKVKKKFQALRSVEYANGPADPNILGMMYWTSTGMLESIEDRNDSMWNMKNIGGIDSMWLKSFGQYADFLEQTLPPNIDALSYSSGGMLKLFMPNIVMIDFADDQKCNYIYGLNTIAGAKLVKATQLIYQQRFGD
jgi:hypothetical protein